MDRIYDLSLLWKAAWDVFPYFDRVGDWNETYRHFIYKAAARQGKELYLTYAEFMAHLADGHTMFDFPRALYSETGTLPFSLRHTEEGYILSACPHGWEKYLSAPVLAINSRPFSEWIKQVCRYSYHVGDFVPAWRLDKVLPLLLCEKNELETAAGKVSFSLKDSTGERITAPALSVPHRFESLPGKLTMRLYDSILYINMPDCQYSGAAKEIAGAIENTEPRAVVLDLRDNIGGMTRYGGEVAELFISGEFHGCQKRTRLTKGIDIASGSQYAMMSREAIESLGDTAEAQRCIDALTGKSWHEYTDTYGAPGHKAVFDGPCVVLTSRCTVSAAEDTLAFFRANQRATVIGLPTCGTTGTPLIQKLSGSGSARVCSVGYKLYDGTEFIGKGIAPDVLLPEKISDLAAGYDAQLAKALEILQ